MVACSDSRPRALGVWGCVIGLLALIAAVLAQSVLPKFLPAAQAERIAVEDIHTLRHRLTTRLKGIFRKEQRPNLEQESWAETISLAATVLALLAIALAVFSTIRREERLYAGVAAALGIGTVAYQLTFLFVGVLLAIILLSSLQNPLDGAFQIAVPVIGVLALLAFAHIAGAALIGPIVFLMGAAALLLAIVFIFNGF